MSPRERLIALISLVFGAITLLCLALYYIPTFLYITCILGVCCLACYYHTSGGGESLFAGLGPTHPRRVLTIPPGLRRWLPGETGANGGVLPPGRLRSPRDLNQSRDSVLLSSQRRFESTALFRRGAGQQSDLFSPRDILMGSYLGRAEGLGLGPGVGVEANPPHPREQLRERLARPNTAVYTPNRRLSFGETLNTMGRFTITPQRHYPLQQTGTSSVGLLPPAQWDGFRKKNILTPRNSPAVHSPVTVKIARPDYSTTRSPFFDHLNSTGGVTSPGLGAPADPCSRETVLSVLKEGRKREVDEEDDTSSTAGQKSKRRRHDSSGSAHSAFEPLLPNGAPSQLVPKPGTLKRGLNSMVEESIMKRSRTSSISSVSCGQPLSGTLGSARNPICSSYSSSQGFAQRKKASTRSLSPLSSPGSSRSQTPERAFKKPREEDARSPSSASSVRSEKTVTEPAPTTRKLTPAPEIQVAAAASSDSAGSGGKRKRKIQLVSSRRGDQISLPPPPELGYTITVKDLDQEKKAALSQIQKVLEDPAPEPEKPAPAPAVTTSSQPPPVSDPTPTLSSLLAAPLAPVSEPTSVTASIPVINLDPAPSSMASTAPTSTAAPATNPLLESLKMMRSNASVTSAAATSAAPVMSVVTAVTTPAIQAHMEQIGGTWKPETTVTASQPTPAPLSQPTPAPLGQPPSTSMPSAFTQVLSQVTKAPTSIPTLGGTSLFGLANPLAAPPSYSASSVVPTTTSAITTETASSTNPLLASMFKPIFGAAATVPASSAPESKPAAPTFKPIFGSATAGSIAFGQPAATVATSAPSTMANASSVFSGLPNSSAAAPASSLFTGLSNSTAGAPASAPSSDPATQPSVKSLFGNWSAAPATSTATTTAPATGSSFQFGAPPTTAAAASPTLSPMATSTTTNNSFSVFGAMTTTSAATQPAPQANSQGVFGGMTTTSAATQPAPQANHQGAFTFSQAASAQNPTTAAFGGFGMASTATTTAAAPAPAAQSSFAFGKPSFEAPSASAFPAASQAAPVAVTKPFSFGGSVVGAVPAPGPAPFAFGGASTTAASTFGTPTKPTFGASSTGFAFGNTTTPSAAPAAPAFGSATQTAGTLPAPAGFSFSGMAAQQHNPATPAQPATGGFNFGAAIGGAQFGTPISNNLPTQTPGFNFGAAAANDKPVFGTSTPVFGQSAAAGPIPFGSPGTPVQGFSALAPSPFGSPSAPAFSIGAGSKPPGARQRLQARRQHPRKK